MLKQPRILIIGAGVAGIAAARKLLENGFLNLTILEAENRIGGRVNTVKWGGNVIDLGAQWCHGEAGNIVYSLAKDYGVLGESKNNYGELPFYSSSRRVIAKEFSERLLEIFYEITFNDDLLENENTSFGEYFIRRYNEIIQDEPEHIKNSPLTQEIIDWFHGMTLCYDGGENWFDISASGLTHYEMCEGDPLLQWKDHGFKTILEILMKSFPKKANSLPILDKVRFNKEARKIIWTNPKEVEVKCSDGTNFYANHVIVTVSLGVLKERHKSMFVPELPLTKQVAIDTLGIGAVNKIFLRFPTKWWPDDLPGFSFIWEQNDKEKIKSDLKLKDSSWIESVFGFYIIDSDPLTLMGWSVGKYTKRAEVLSENELIEGCMYILNKFVGDLYDIPMPTKATWSKWGTNPHFRGSYSFRTVESDKKGVSSIDISHPLIGESGELPILFAGEATHPKFYSTVHGALETGFREAKRIVDKYRSPETLRTKVAIVGAGMAGLGAATAFIDSGFEDFLILEATDRIGGRINTLNLNGKVIELGAQWLHDSDNYLYKISSENRLIADEFSEEGLGAYIRDDGFVFDDFMVKKIDFIVGQILEDCEKFTDAIDYPESVGHFLLERFQSYATGLSDKDKEMAFDLLDWHLRFQVIDNSCVNLFEVSAKDWGKYSCLGKDGQKHLNIVNGYQSIVNIILDKIPKEKIKLCYPVIDVSYDKDNISIMCQFDRNVICDHVILTTSIGFLKQNLINFNPKLPQSYLDCIENFGFHGMGKIFLIFKERWWKEDGFQLVWRTNISLPDEKQWLRCLSGFDSVLNHDSLLVGWIGGRWIEQMEELDEETVGRECVGLLRMFLKREDIPYPEKTIRTCWTINPWIKGGYSHTTPLTDELGVGAETFCKPVEVNGIPRLCFAGEASHESQFSTTHGAFHSGMSAAEKLMCTFRKPKL